MITERKTGLHEGGYYVVKSSSIPSNTTVATTIDAEETMNVGMQLVLKKLKLPYQEMVGWPGEISLTDDGILHPDTHKSSQKYITHVGDNEVTIKLSLVSIHYSLISVDCSFENDAMVISVNDSGKQLCLKLNTDLHQPGNKYSQTVMIGVKIETRLKSGKSAEQIVYVMGVVEFTPEEFKSFKYSI